MHMPEVSLSKTEFKALSSESRTKILKMLDERNHTLSELAAKTGMAAPTVKQHASVLVQSGLIELRDEGRKWKYYALTKKGKDIVNAKSNNTNILLILSSAILVAGLGIALMFAGQGAIFSQNIAPGIGGEAPPLGTAAQPASDKSIIAREIVPTEISASSQALSGCQPGFDAAGERAEALAQKCRDAKDRGQCEAIDEYSATITSFEQADGKPDCEWTENSAQTATK